MSRFVPLPSTIDLEIPVPVPDRKKIIQHVVDARDSTTDKLPVSCKCRDNRSWCSTPRCACIKADAKFGVACHMRDVIVSLIFQILQLLTCVRKMDYGLGTEITKEDPVGGSAEERQEKTNVKFRRDCLQILVAQLQSLVAVFIKTTTLVFAIQFCLLKSHFSKHSRYTSLLLRSWIRSSPSASLLTPTQLTLLRWSCWADSVYHVYALWKVSIDQGLPEN